MQKEEYLKKCLKLYSSTFEDKPEFTSALFDAFSDNLYTVTDTENVISMLFSIDVTLGEEKGRYIYAAATDEKYRSRGYMSNLLKRVIAESASKYSFLCLSPASEKLEKYYEKFGFFTSFFEKKQIVNSHAYGGNIKSITEPYEYMRLRKLFTDSNCIEYPKEYYECAFKYYTAITDSVSKPSFLVIGDEFDGIIESFGSSDGAKAFCKFLNKDSIAVTSRGKEMRTGMIYRFDSKEKTDLYMGIRLI